MTVGRFLRSAGPAVAEGLWASALAEGGILWLAGRSVLFLTILVGWLVLL